MKGREGEEVEGCEGGVKASRSRVQVKGRGGVEAGKGVIQGEGGARGSKV